MLDPPAAGLHVPHWIPYGDGPVDDDVAAGAMATKSVSGRTALARVPARPIRQSPQR